MKTVIVFALVMAAFAYSSVQPAMDAISERTATIEELTH